jgi:hypothetical protein
VILDHRLVAAGDENEMLDAGSISFGIALVAGRKRVPSPATGNTALRMGFMDFRGAKEVISEANEEKKDAVRGPARTKSA